MTGYCRSWRGIDDVVRLLGGEWTSTVLMALDDEPLQYGEILNVIGRGGTVDGRMLYEATLTRTLRRLVIDGLVERIESRSTLPRSVSYSLSDPAKELLSALAPAAGWAARHTDLIDLAQRRRSRNKTTVPCRPRVPGQAS